MPYTIVFKSFPAGAEIRTFFAPARKCASDLALEQKKPVHSKTISIRISFQGRFSGFFSERITIRFPSTVIDLSSLVIICPQHPPCTLSYFSRCASIAGSVKSLIAATSIVSSSRICLNANLPILPNPLIAIFVILDTLLIYTICFL